MIKLLATALQDGWAFVKQRNRVLLVRPPYEDQDLREVSESTVEKAVMAHGFAASDREFQDWRSLIEYLDTEVLKRREALGLGEPDVESVRALVREAPPEVIRSYLDRIESELLPQAEQSVALDLLTALLSSKHLPEDQELYERAVSLIEQCRRGQAVEEERVRELADVAELGRCFPNAVERYNASHLADYARRLGRPGALAPIRAY